MSVRDLNSLRIFRDVVKAGGYSALNRQTGQSRATLSRHISDLENELGARLIERSTRSFRLSEQGQLLYERSLDILGQLDEAVAMVETLQSEPAGLVRIAIPPSILRVRLGDEIMRYMQEHRKVKVHIDATNRPVDIYHEPVDFVIRARGKLDYPLDYVPVLLAKMDIILVVHPKWQADLKPTLEESLQYIPSLAWQHTGSALQWQLINHAQEPIMLTLQPRLIVNDLNTLLDAALAGMGMAMIPKVHAQPYLDSGQLLQVNLDAQPLPSLIHAVHLGNKRMRPAVRHLLDWLKDITADLRE